MREEPKLQTTQSSKGFFGSLLDFSFSALITTKIIKAVYIILTVVISLGALGFLILELKLGGSHIVVGIIGAPIGWLLYMIFARVWCEFMIIIFRIGEDVRRIVDGPSAMTGVQPWPPSYAPPPVAPPPAAPRPVAPSPVAPRPVAPRPVAPPPVAP